MVLQRVGQMAAVVAVVVAITFVILRLSGDPVRFFLPPDATDAEVAAARARYGFDDPVPVQFWRHLSRMLQGDFGRSWRYREAALPVVLERLPATLLLTATALAVSAAIAVPLGIAAAARRGSVADSVSMVGALAGQSMPVFWIGILLVLLFSLTLRLLPTSGYGTLRHLVLPSLALGMYSAGRLARLVRAQTLDSLGQDYIRTAQSKGLGPRRVLYRHAVRNSLLPIVTLLGLEFGTLMGGSIVTESVFAWPGMGLLAVQSIISRDYPVVLTIVVMMAVIFSLVNLATDLLYVKIDPRIQDA